MSVFFLRDDSRPKDGKANLIGGLELKKTILNCLNACELVKYCVVNYLLGLEVPGRFFLRFLMDWKRWSIDGLRNRP